MSKRIVERFDADIFRRTGPKLDFRQVEKLSGIRETDLVLFLTNIDKPLNQMTAADFDNRISVLEKLIAPSNTRSRRTKPFLLRTMELILTDSRGRRSKLSGTTESFEALRPLATDLKMTQWLDAITEILASKGINESKLREVIQDFSKSPAQLTSVQRSDRLRVLHLMKQASYLLTSHEKLLNYVITTSGVRQTKEQHNATIARIAKAKAEAVAIRSAQEAALRDWSNRTGSYARFAGFGQPSQDFTIQWGFHNWDTNNACRECAAGRHGWGSGSKFGGGAWCQGRSGSLVGAGGYGDSGNWGRQGVFGERKWWTCRKSSAQIQKENREYESARPSVSAIPTEKQIPRLPDHVDMLLNPDALAIFRATHFVVDYLLDLYLEELYMTMSPQEIRIGLPVEKFVEFYKMLESDSSIVKTQIAVFNDMIKNKTEELSKVSTELSASNKRSLDLQSEIAGLNKNISELKTQYERQLSEKDVDATKLKADYERRLTEKEAEAQAELQKLLAEQNAMQIEFKAQQDSLNGEIENLKKTMAEKDLQNNEAVMALRNEIESLKSQMEANIDEYTAEKTRLSEDIAKTQLEIAASVAELDAVRANHVTEKELMEADTTARLKTMQEEMQKEIDALNEIKLQYEQLQLDIEKQQQDMKKLQSAEKSLALQLETNKSSMNTLTIGLLVAVFIIIIMCILLWNRPSAS